MAKKKNGNNEGAEKRQRKREVEKKLKKARSLCYFWVLVQDQYPHEIHKVNKEIARLVTKRDKMRHDLDRAPKEHEKAKMLVQRASLFYRVEIAEPKIAKMLRMKAELIKLQGELEDVEITEEQMELLRKAGDASITL